MLGAGLLCFGKASYEEIESEKSPQPALRTRTFHFSPFARA
jgi:hypothetical protein